MTISPKNLLGFLITRIVNLRLRHEKYRGDDVVLGRDVEGAKHVSFAGQDRISRGVIFTGEIKIGIGTTVSANSYFIGPVEIGNYCQIGANAGFLAQDHPTSFLTTYINQNLFSGRLRKHITTSKIIIGHGVWIGQGAIIVKGVTVGNGAVIGAGAVVTKSIPDYSIAVGNPARIIKKRFPDELCDLINATQWWLKSPDDLLPFERAFNIDYSKNPDEFTKALKNLRP